MAEPQNRRITDSPLHGERLATLEATVQHIGEVGLQTLDELREHAREETHLFKEHSEAVAKLATSQTGMQHAIERISHSLEVLAEHTTRLTMLEDFRERTEPVVSEFSKKTDRMYWIGGGVATIVLALLVAVLKHLSGLAG